MVSLPKIIGMLSCGVVLCLGLPNNGQAINNYAQQLKMERYADRQSTKIDEQTAKGLQTIYGELLQVRHNQYLVRKYDGDIVRLHVDSTTQRTGRLTQGDRIVATVDDKEHAQVINPLPPIE